MKYSTLSATIGLALISSACVERTVIQPTVAEPVRPAVVVPGHRDLRAHRDRKVIKDPRADLAAQ